MAVRFHTLQKLFSRATRWTQGTMARDARDIWTNARSPKAISFCLLGGLHHCYRGAELTKAIKRLKDVLSKEFGFTDIIGFNDNDYTTIKEIRKAIKHAKV